jgi:hypothetical protein
MANHSLINNATLENLPRYEKWQSPERCSIKLGVRRGLSCGRAAGAAQLRRGQAEASDAGISTNHSAPWYDRFTVVNQLRIRNHTHLISPEAFANALRILP